MPEALAEKEMVIAELRETNEVRLRSAGTNSTMPCRWHSCHKLPGSKL
jgi:hypothetical protein